MRPIGLASLFPDDVELKFGAPDSALDHSTAQTNEGLVWGLGNNKVLIFTDYANRNKDHGLAAQADPGIAIFSNSDPTVSPNEYVFIKSKSTGGIIGMGAGPLEIQSATDENLSLNAQGTGTIRFNSSGRFSDNDELRFGSGDDAAILHSQVQTNDGLIWGLGDSTTLILTANANKGADHGLAAGTNPGIAIFSSRDPVANPNEYGLIEANATSFDIDIGAGLGYIRFGTSGTPGHSPGVFFSSGIGTVEFDTNVHFDGAVQTYAGISMSDNNRLKIGSSTSTDFNMLWSTTQTEHTLIMALGNTAKSAILTTNANDTKNHGIAAFAHPAIVGQSANDPEAAGANQYWYVTQDATDAIFGLGAALAALQLPQLTKKNGLTGDESSETVADDASINLVDGKTGWGHCNIGDNQEWADFDFKADGTVHIKNSSANVVTTDTDVKLCIWNSSGNVVSIKNRLGSSLTVRYEIHYSS